MNLSRSITAAGITLALMALAACMEPTLPPNVEETVGNVASARTPDGAPSKNQSCAHGLDAARKSKNPWNQCELSPSVNVVGTLPVADVSIDFADPSNGCAFDLWDGSTQPIVLCGTTPNLKVYLPASATISVSAPNSCVRPNVTYNNWDCTITTAGATLTLDSPAT